MPKRILILGPESTGKSTLAEDLANYFDEPWVPEYAREYLEELGRPYSYEDLLTIAKGQIASEDLWANQAEEFLFIDTDLRVIYVWSEHKYGKVDSFIAQGIATRKYDLVLVTNTDLPWTPDPLREHPEKEMREHFLEKYLRLAKESGFPYHLISGNRQDRLKKAIGICEDIK